VHRMKNDHGQVPTGYMPPVSSVTGCMIHACILSIRVGLTHTKKRLLVECITHASVYVGRKRVEGWGGLIMTKPMAIYQHHRQYVPTHHICETRGILSPSPQDTFFFPECVTVATTAARGRQEIGPVGSLSYRPPPQSACQKPDPVRGGVYMQAVTSEKKKRPAVTFLSGKE